MPISSKTQVERTAKTRQPRCYARVGGLCRFRSPAERVPTEGLKTGRCANVREHCGNGKRRRKPPAGGFQQRKEPQAAKQDKAAGVVRAPRRSHLPAVRAVSGICKGVPNAAKNSQRALQYEKGAPFQGKRLGSNKAYEVNTENSHIMLNNKYDVVCMRKLQEKVASE